MTITSIADYYTFTETYNTLKNMIAVIKDDDVRKEYSTRCKDKYDSLKDESVKWKDVVKAYEEQRSEENTRLAEEAAAKAKEERETQTRKTRIALAQTRIKKLAGYDSQPANVKKAEQAVEACKSYSEYNTLHSDYIRSRQELLALPKEEDPTSGQSDTDSGTDNSDTE